jgi:hypothetical protein
LNTARGCRFAALSLTLCVALTVGAAQPTATVIPDLSGVWAHDRGTAVGPAAQGRNGGSPLPTSPAGGNAVPAGRGGSGEFLRAFSYQVDGSPPPLQPWAAEVLQRHVDSITKEGRQILASVQQCLPMGIPVFLVQPYPYQIIQTPELIAIIGEANWEVRLIHMNRPHPAKLKPSWYGDSVGHWQDETLVVDTVGQNDKTLISALGIPKSNALHLVERYRLVNDGKRLEVRVTIDDPGVFTKPWEALWVLDRQSNLELLEYICAENEKDSQYMKSVSPAGSQVKP